VDPTGHRVEIGGDEADRERALEVIRLGLPEEARQSIVLVEGEGEGGFEQGHFYIDPSAIQGAGVEDRNFQRLEFLAQSKKTAVVVLEPAGTVVAGVDAKTGKPRQYEVMDAATGKMTPIPLEFPGGLYGVTLQRPSEPEDAPIVSSRPDASQVIVLDAPLGVAVESLAHELYTHEFLQQKGLPSAHRSQEDAVAQDAAESERVALENLRTSGRVTEADLQRALRARAEIVLRQKLPEFRRLLPNAPSEQIDDFLDYYRTIDPLRFVDFDPVERAKKTGQ
jgi:hypothetical protein